MKENRKKEMKRKWEKETSVMLRGKDRKVGGKLPHLVNSEEIGSIRLGEKIEREKEEEKINCKTREN